jgi:CheY-like chemotaxis protein
VLVVDDSPDERYFLRRALGEDSRLAIIGELDDGERAIAYLGGEGEYADRNSFPLPDLMLLDLKMPRRTGHEVLEWMLAREQSKPIVVVLTNSILPEDISKSLDLGAAAYHVKTAERGEQPELIRALEKLLDDRVGRLR